MCKGPDAVSSPTTYAVKEGSYGTTSGRGLFPAAEVFFISTFIMGAIPMVLGGDVGWDLGAFFVSLLFY